MTTKIYVRERTDDKKGKEEPRYRIAAITGDRTKIRFSAHHFRKIELETIIKDVGAELIYLQPLDDEDERKGKCKD